MKIYTETSLESFEAWSGAVDTLDKIREANKCEDLEIMLEELYPDGIDETALNDLLWFEDEWIFEILGLSEEEEEEEAE